MSDDRAPIDLDALETCLATVKHEAGFFTCGKALPCPNHSSVPGKETRRHEKRIRKAALYENERDEPQRLGDLDADEYDVWESSGFSVKALIAECRRLRAKIERVEALADDWTPHGAIWNAGDDQAYGTQLREALGIPQREPTEAELEANRQHLERLKNFRL